MALRSRIPTLAALMGAALALPAFADEPGAKLRIAANDLSVGAPSPGSGAQPAQTPPGTTPAQPTNAPASIATPAPGPAEGQAVTGLAKAPPLPQQPSAAYRAPNPAQPPPTTVVGPTSPPGPQAPAVGGPGQPP